MQIKIRKLLLSVFVLVLGVSIVLTGCSSSTNESASSNSKSSSNAEKQNSSSSSIENKVGSQDKKKEKITLRLAHIFGVQSLPNTTLVNIQKRLSEETDGQIELQIFPASQMGNEREIIEGVTLGTMEMGLATHSYMSKYIPEYGLFDLPFVFRDEDHLLKVLNGPIGDEIGKKLIEKKNLRYLAWTPMGFRGMMTTDRPINTLADLKGLKIRSPEVETYTRTLSLLGTIPTPMPWGDVYTGLETGVVKGVESPPQAMYDSKLQEVTKYFTFTRHMQVSLGPVISEEVWGSIPGDLQAVISKVFKEEFFKAAASSKESNQDAIDKFKEAGLIIGNVSESEIKKMQDAVKPLWDDYAKEINAQDLLQEIVDTK